MRPHLLSPWHKLQEFIHGLDAGTKFLFSPLYGLGDRASFYAYLRAFKDTHGADIAIVCLSGDEDPVATLFPGLLGDIVIVPKGLAVAPLDLTHWVYGAPAPAAGKLFFTWHWAFGDGSVAADYERAALSDGTRTHKRLIREILRLSPSIRPSSIEVPRSAAAGLSKGDRVMLCPRSNTIPAPPDQWWLMLARALRAEGFTPIFNVASAASMLMSGASPDAVGFDIYDAPISQFLEDTAGGVGVISARSGMCELLALHGRVPYSIVSQQPVSPFWSLGTEFGRPPEVSVSTLTRSNEDSVRVLIKSLTRAGPR